MLGPASQTPASLSAGEKADPEDLGCASGTSWRFLSGRQTTVTIEKSDNGALGRLYQLTLKLKSYRVFV